MDLSSIVSHLGDFGKFQKRVFILACIIEIFVGIHMLANVFLMGEPKHRCYISNCDNSSHYYEDFVDFSIPNVTDEHDQLSLSACTQFSQITSNATCDKTSFNQTDIVSCNSYVWDDADFKSTTISEFGIVCNKSWDAAFSSSFFMIGFLVGSAGFGMISDRFGRKTVIMLASTLLLFSSTLTAFSTSFMMFSICRFITAGSVCGLIQAGYILGLEYIGSSKRLVCGSIMSVMFAVGELILAALAYNIRNWRYLELSFAIPGALLLLYYWLLPESVRWLVSQGKYQRALNTVTIAAKYNNVCIPENCLKMLEGDFVPPRSLGPWNLLKTPRLRKWSLNIFLNWTVNSMVYYGLALNAGNLYGDIYTNFSLLAFIEIPSVLLSAIGLVHFGSRRVLCSTMVLCGLALAAMISVPADLSWLSLMFAIIGRSGIAASFSVIYLYSVEIFPTVLRSTGIGISNTFGRLGSIAAPIFIQLGEIYHWLPMAIFSSASIISGLLILLLPETHKQRLPDTVEEAENFGLIKEAYSIQSTANANEKSELLRNIS